MKRSSWHLYDDIYAALYESNLRRWHGDKLNASVATAFGLSITAMMNVGFLTTLATAFTGPATAGPADRVIAYGLVGLCLLANIRMFLYRARYKRVVAHFRTQSPAYQKRRTVVAWSYVLFSVMSLFAVLLLMAIFRGSV